MAFPELDIEPLRYFIPKQRIPGQAKAQLAG
jgi:hypothetical protein